MNTFGIEVIVPIFVCVLLPVTIVWLVMRAKKNETDRKAEIMLKAIESGSAIAPDFFKPQKTDQRTLKEKLLGRLTGACVTSMLGIVFLVGGIGLGWKLNLGALPSLPLLGGILLAVGIALFVVFFVSRKMLAKEIEAEENGMNENK